MHLRRAIERSKRLRQGDESPHTFEDHCNQRIVTARYGRMRTQSLHITCEGRLGCSGVEGGTGHSGKSKTQGYLHGLQTTRRSMGRSNVSTLLTSFNTDKRAFRGCHDTDTSARALCSISDGVHRYHSRNA
jgi:hypothetical protein